MKCETCEGNGWITVRRASMGFHGLFEVDCTACDGTGDEPAECDACGEMQRDVTTFFSPAMGDTSACAACRGEEE